MRLGYLTMTGAVALMALSGNAAAQVIGSYDNFDCFNDTGQTAEGFEIDVQDITKPNLTREFPSNFSTTPWVIRYGLPTVTPYNWTVATPDAEHSYDAGHKGVLITWKAAWDGAKWVAPYGAQPFGAGQVAGDGTPYVAKPTYTNGDSCWYYGLGQAYPTSGCDHFGISFGAGVKVGQMRYHWKVPDPALAGHLINGPQEASIPPSPVLYYGVPVGAAGPVVNAVAEAPEREPDPAINPNLQFGTAYWVKVTTLQGLKRVQLDKLQKANVQKAKEAKAVTWGLLQRPPKQVAGAPEKLDVENDALVGADVAVTKQYEYFKFTGAFKPDDHEALCNPAVNCKQPTTTAYTVVVHGGRGGVTITVPNGDLGDYIGAHVNGDNAK